MAAGFKSLVDGVGYAVGAPPVPPALGGFVGLLDFTGMSVGSLTATIFQPGTAALEVTGYAPNWVSTTGTRFFPLTGNVTVEGVAAAWATPNVVRPGTGTLTVTGYAPQWVVDSRVQFGAGALTVTGYAPAWARYADCVLFDSTHITFDSDALTWDLVSEPCPVEAPVPVPVPGSGGAPVPTKKKRRTLRPPPLPNPRFVPWLDPYTPWAERDQEPAETPPATAKAAPGLDALVGAPGQNLPIEVASLPDTWGAELADRLLNAQDIWEAVQQRQAVQVAIEAVIVAEREADADDEEALMLLLT